MICGSICDRLCTTNNHSSINCLFLMMKYKFATCPNLNYLCSSLTCYLHFGLLSTIDLWFPSFKTIDEQKQKVNSLSCHDILKAFEEWPSWLLSSHRRTLCTYADQILCCLRLRQEHCALLMRFWVENARLH